MKVYRSPILLGAVVLVAVLSAGCADGSVDGSASDSDDSSQDSTLESVAGSSPSAGDTTPEGTTPVSNEQIDPGLQPYIDIAVADLAQRLSIDAAEVDVVSATLAEWPDSGLGCPQPGMQYAQVSTDGSVIVLMANDRAYRYHSGGSRTPFLCEQPL
jgi:hypothetical protein